MHYFIGLVIISVCVNDVRIYGTLLLLPPYFCFFLFCFSHPGFFVVVFCCHFDIDVCVYTTCTFFVVDSQADFAVDNVQRRELVNFYGV